MTTFRTGTTFVTTNTSLPRQIPPKRGDIVLPQKPLDLGCGCSSEAPAWEYSPVTRGLRNNGLTSAMLRSVHENINELSSRRWRVLLRLRFASWGIDVVNTVNEVSSSAASSTVLVISLLLL